MVNINQMFVHALHDMVACNQDKLITRLAAILSNCDGDININSIFNGIPVYVKIKDAEGVIAYIKANTLKRVKLEKAEIVNPTSYYSTIRVYFMYTDDEFAIKHDTRDISLTSNDTNKIKSLFEIEYL